MRILSLFAILFASACAGHAATASVNTPVVNTPGMQELAKKPDKDVWIVRQVVRIHFDENWNPVKEEKFIERVRIRRALPPKNE